MPIYLDAAEFTALFHDRKKHRGRIAEGIFLIAKNCARTHEWPDRNDRDDAVQTATLWALRAIDNFDCSRGTTAFSYFTTVVIRAIKRERIRQESDRKIVNLSAFDEQRSNHWMSDDGGQA